MPPKTPRIYCCASECMNSSIKRPELSFFKLPSEDERRMEWLQRISREDLSDKKAKSYVVCEEHFHAHEILRTEHRKNLKKNVVPTLNLSEDAPHKKVVVFDVPLLKVENSTQTIETSTDSIAQTDASIPRKRKLSQNTTSRTKRIKVHDVDNHSLKQQKEVFHKLCDKFLSDEFSKLVKNKIEADSKSKTQYLPITSEINEKVLSILKVKVDHMKAKERICTVVVDAMEIKTRIMYNTKEDKFIGFHEIDGVQTSDPATLVLVMVIKGIVFNWQQPVGFALLSEYRDYDKVIKWMDKLIVKLVEIGLDVKAVVSNLDPDMCHLTKYRAISPEKPFFSVIKGKKLYYILDTSQLLMMMRDSFLQNEFHFQGNVADFEHIMNFYISDAAKSVRLAPKVTQSHVEPSIVEKKELRFAVQLFSNSVAAAILTYIDFYVIDESGRDTVKMIKLINDLYDLLNSTNLDDENGNVFKKAFNGDSAQLKLFTDAINFFRNLRLVSKTDNSDVTQSAKFIEGFQITISAIMLLFEDLNKRGIKFLRTKRLNTNVTYKIFAKIKSNCGTMNTLTVRQFTTAYRELFLEDLMKPPAGKDCSLEIASLLSAKSSPEDFDDDYESSDSSLTVDTEQNDQVKCSDYNQIEIPDNNTVVYLSSYLLKRCAEKHKECQILKSYIVPVPEQRIQNFGHDNRYKKYQHYCEVTCSSLLVVPYDDFIHYVEKMEEEFRNCLKKKHVEKDVAANIYKVISELNFLPPCPCFPMVYLKKLFIRMRIFHTVQYNNNKWKTIVAKRKYFTIPNL